MLIEDWCQQYPSHSVGSLAFGADGALYVSAGDGASFNFADYGQDGSAGQPVRRPARRRRRPMTPPTAEGGALRSQDVRTTGDPTSLDGTILRVDPDTGAALPGNPNAGSSGPERAPRSSPTACATRSASRSGPAPTRSGPATSAGTPGRRSTASPTPTGAVRNFGWPCYEGTGRQGGYDNLNLNLCETLYSAGRRRARGAVLHVQPRARGGRRRGCPTGGSSISGLAFYPAGGSFPAAYEGALFFADYSRDCIWAMLRGANGLPDPANIETLRPGAAGPVDLESARAATSTTST